MKKLLVMTLAVSAASVMMAADCTPETPDPVDCGTVYNIKFTGKTTVGKPITTKEAASLCDPDSDSTSAFLARVPGSLTIDGYVAYCDCGCAAEVLDLESGTSLFWATRPAKGAVDMVNNINGSESFTVLTNLETHVGARSDNIVLDSIGTNNVTVGHDSFIHVIGLKQNQAEIFSVFGGTVVYTAGSLDQDFEWNASALGTFNTKAHRYVSFSGSFAGWMTASYAFVKVPATLACEKTKVWDCTLADLLEDEDTVAFGTWSVKYNAAASKKFGKDGTPPKAPAWAY